MSFKELSFLFNRLAILKLDYLEPSYIFGIDSKNEDDSEDENEEDDEDEDDSKNEDGDETEDDN